MHVLPDLLRDGLRLVVVGTAVGECQFRRGHYYAGRGQAFWELLVEAGLTPHRLRPDEDVDLRDLGIGLTDIVKDVAQPGGGGTGFDVPAFLATMERHQPGWVAFNGKAAATACARGMGQRCAGLGRQTWTVAGRPVFVLPSSSPANRRRDYEGRPTRVEWWAELGRLVEGSPPPPPACAAYR